MIDHATWRSLIYRLAEEYPDCLMLNFTIKLISDAGFQSEITSISTAAQQIEVYSRVLKTAIIKFLTNPDDVQKNIEECAVSTIKNMLFTLQQLACRMKMQISEHEFD